MNKDFIAEIHKAICKHYQKNYGGLVSDLKSWNFSFVETATIPELSAVVEKYESTSEDNDLVRRAFNELVVRGYLEEMDWGYCLTEVGLNIGTQNIFQRFIAFLNKNPGAAIIISMVSIVISLVALYVSYAKP